MMKKNNSILLYFLIALILVFSDQLIKWWMVSYHSSLVIANHGIIFGLIDNPIISYAILAIGVVFLVWMIKSHSRRLGFGTPTVASGLSFSLIIAGAVSNLIDRIFRGYIVDYVHFLNINVFNLADVFIVAGVLIYAYQIFTSKK